jgi:hypothetical protein
VHRRLEDRIRNLCSRALETQDLQELCKVLEELRGAIHEHTRRLRKAVVVPLGQQRRGMHSSNRIEKSSLAAAKNG